MGSYIPITRLPAASGGATVPSGVFTGGGISGVVVWPSRNWSSTRRAIGAAAVPCLPFSMITATAMLRRIRRRERDEPAVVEQALVELASSL